jgi:FixJ family two-component response regulator
MDIRAHLVNTHGSHRAITMDRAIVHVLDDEDGARSSLSNLLKSVGYETVLYRSALEFILAERADRLGCLVLEAHLSGSSGLELQQYLLQQRISTPVIVMSALADVQMSVKCMKAGAIDFLTKPFRDQDMLDAVAAAIESDRGRRQAAGRLRVLKERYAGMTPRERQVMALVTAGKLNKEVAAELKLSQVTVKIHRSSAMRKMTAKTLVELVRMAESLGLDVEARQERPLLVKSTVL